MKFQLDSNVINAGLRHAGTSVATVFTVFGLLGFIPQDQVTALIADLQEITSGLTQAFGGFSKALIIIGPIAIAWFTKVAGASATLSSQLKSVTTNPQVKIEGQIVTTKEVAAAVPSTQVVSEQQT